MCWGYYQGGYWQRTYAAIVNIQEWEIPFLYLFQVVASEDLIR